MAPVAKILVNIVLLSSFLSFTTALPHPGQLWHPHDEVDNLHSLAKRQDLGCISIIEAIFDIIVPLADVQNVTRPELAVGLNTTLTTVSPTNFVNLVNVPTKIFTNQINGPVVPLQFILTFDQFTVTVTFDPTVQVAELSIGVDYETLTTLEVEGSDATTVQSDLWIQGDEATSELSAFLVTLHEDW